MFNRIWWTITTNAMQLSASWIKGIQAILLTDFNNRTIAMNGGTGLRL